MICDGGRRGGCLERQMPNSLLVTKKKNHCRAEGVVILISFFMKKRQPSSFHHGRSGSGDIDDSSPKIQEVNAS